MFEAFALEMIELADATLRVRHGGSGTPVLLLHGYPRTHATWHRVAPILARTHSVAAGRGMNSGHHMAEKAPEELAQAIEAFLSAGRENGAYSN